MKRLLFLCLCIFFFRKNVNAQYIEAEQCIGGNGQDVVSFVRATSDSGLLVFIVTSSSNKDFSDNHGGNDLGLIKLNKYREIEWKKSIGDTIGDDLLSSFVEYGDKFYLLTYARRDSYIDSFQVYHEKISRDLLTVLNKDGSINWQNRVSPISSYTDQPPAMGIKIDTLTGDVYVFKSQSLQKYDRNGNKLWERSFDIFSDIHCDFGVCTPKINIIPLKNKQSLMCTFLSQEVGIFGHTIPYLIFSKLDSNGIEITRSDTLDYINYDLFFAEGKYKSEDSLVIRMSGISLSVITLNVNDMGTVLNLTASPNINFYDYFLEMTGRNMGLQTNNNILKMLDDGYYLTTSVGYDSVTQVYSSLININNIQTGTYHSYDVSAFTSSVINFYYCPKDSTLLYIYPDYGDSTIRFAKYRLDGSLAFNRSVFNLGNDSINYWNNKGYYGAVYGNKLYNNFIVSDKNTGVQKFQIFQVLNIDNGDVEFENKNTLQDSFTFRHISPLNDKELFVISDFLGIHKCYLGGKDISFSRVLMASNKIYGAAYIDYNNNNTYDSGDVLYNLAMLGSSKGNQSVSTFMYGSLYALNMVDTGTWTTTLTMPNNYFSVSPSNKVTTHSDYNHSDTAIFILHPLGDINDLDVNMVNTFVTRLNTSTNYEITYSNKGTYSANGTVKLILDHRLQYQSASPVIAAQNGDTLTWNFTNLKANEFRKITINIKAGFPPDLNAGDTVTSVTSIFNTRNDTTPSDNQSRLNEIIRAAYDPNDKTSNTGDEITPAQIANGEYITYTIRFQNTGTDTAFKVIILDTLDANLDWSSFEMVNASHNFSVELIDGHILKFSSNNIILPDSAANANGSHGFVAYKIKPKAGLSQGALIKNTAHIYFDFNTPVKTGTVNTRVTILTSLQNNLNNNGKIKIYPNPNSGNFTIECNTDYSSPLSVSIFDITGKTVYENQLPNSQKTVVTINTENLAAGIYSIVLKTDREHFTRKIIIQK